ncbi:Glucosamine kinase GspK [Rhodobacteraceae bacterium THAF1]|uniref:BadF/BadG/BcrA/BcrD ATPase family protein n=1 Tax=Palleronia sp. THAF1 TaxID=2587842 RepID=UPI000F3BCE5A|nr:BadF/BadG/BcrA/BcrD ATPase family protein [Palleronia sp. THAF1]QFU09530.1 Glucosamine kinase GspK [Palleronia sp. THAF1]VDC21789.1 Glucosamine kinase GspK [Rhodobacteraceae bacterium THAF1]
MSDQNPVLIGVDGGGSGCRVALRTPDGSVVRTEGGPANATTDRDGAVRNVLHAVRAAVDESGLADGVMRDARAHLGLAGIVDQADAQAVGTAFTDDLPVARCTVSDDRTTHAIGALGEEDGFVISVGTGSTVARVTGGTVRGLGGWGLILGDEASGAWLGRMALSRCLMAVDGLIPHSDLTRDLIDRHAGAAGIVRFARTATPRDFAALTPLILADDADPVAASLLSEGAAYLDRALTTLGLTPGARLCLTGGLGPTYAAWLAASNMAHLTRSTGDALDGALTLAGNA